MPRSRLAGHGVEWAWALAFVSSLSKGANWREVSAMVASATNPIPTICAARRYEVQKCMTLTNHQCDPQSVVVSKKFRDTLSADEKKVLRDAAQECAKYGREQVRASVSSMLESHKKSAMEVTQLPPAEVAKLRKHATAGGTRKASRDIHPVERLHRRAPEWTFSQGRPGSKIGAEIAQARPCSGAPGAPAPAAHLARFIRTGDRKDCIHVKRKESCPATSDRHPRLRQYCTAICQGCSTQSGG